MPARQQRDRRGAHRRRPRSRRSAAPLRGAQPRPRDAPGEAAVVEPGRLVVGEARGQDLGLPGAGRRLEAFELRDHRVERIGPLHARVRRDVLPVEQEAQEVARGDRLDLARSRLIV